MKISMKLKKENSDNITNKLDQVEGKKHIRDGR